MKLLPALLLTITLFSCSRDEPVSECSDGFTSATFQEGKQIVETMTFNGTDTILDFNIQDGENIVFRYKSYGPSCVGGNSGADTTGLFFEIPRNTTSFRKEFEELASIKTYYTVSNPSAPLITGKVTIGEINGLVAPNGYWHISARADVAGPGGRIVQMGMVWDFIRE